MSEINNLSAKNSKDLHNSKDAQPEIKGDNLNSHDASEPSSLWRDAYEHKGAIAGAAVGAALVAGVAAVEHTPLGRMLGLAKKVLVIEDTSIFAHCIKKSLLKQGENVTVLKGIESLKPFVGIAEDGSKQPLNLNKFRAAFVDGNLFGKLNGPDIVPTLHGKRVFTIAMSSEKETNEAMLGLGANMGAQKPVIMQALREDSLRVPQSVKNPFETQGRLNNMRDHFHDPADTERRRVMEKEMMTEFLEEEKAAAITQRK